jgi:hypothetical protein
VKIILSAILCYFSIGGIHANTSINEAKSCLEGLENTDWTRRFSKNQSSDFIRVNDGRAQIKIQIQLRYQSYFSEAELQEATLLLENSKEVIKRFYQQYFIDLDIDFEHAYYDFTQRSPHPTPNRDKHIIYIKRDMDEYMNLMYWGVNRHWSPEMRGKIYTHEFSHLLGLKDEYDTTLATRIGEPDNIMRNYDANPGRFYPHQIKELLAPICGHQI